MPAKQTANRPPTRLGGIQQAFVRVQGIAGEVLCVGAPRAPTAYIGVLEVGGISYDLKSHQEQERLNDLWQQILSGVTFPLQVLWRSLPLQLDPYLNRFEPLPGTENEQARVWETLAAAHRQHVRSLAARHTLLRRRVYLLTRVSADDQARASLKSLFWPGPPRVPPAEALEQARAELEVRLSEVAHRLELLALSWRRLGGLAELGAFYQSCLAPSTAARFPLAAETLEGVDGPPRVLHRPATPAPLVTCSRCQAQTPGWALYCGDCGAPLSVGQQKHPNLPLTASAPLSSLKSTAEPPQSPAHTGRRRVWFAREKQEPPERKALFPQVADVLAPASIEVTPDLLRVGEEWQQVLVVSGLPRTIEAGWLRPLLELDEPLELCWHLRPQESARMEDLLRRKRTQFQATRLLALGKGNLVDPHIEIAQADIEDLMLRVASGAERLFDLVWLIRVWGSTKKEMTERVTRIQHVLHLLRLSCRLATYEQGPALRSCLPQVRPQLDGEGLLLPSETISTAFPFVATSLFHPHGVLVGVTPAKELIVLDPWEAANANMVVFGPPGQGKSTLIKTLEARLALGYQLQRPGELGFQLFVIDPESEYNLQAAALGGQKVLLSPGSPDRINPFDLPVQRPDRATGKTDVVDVLAEHISDLHRLLEILLAERTAPGAPGQLTQEEDSILDLALFETYRRAGITRDPRTHARPAPLLRDLAISLYQGTWGGAQRSLLNRLLRFVDGSESGLFSGATTVNARSPLVVFDTHACQTDMQQIIAQFLISTFVWGQSFQGTIPRFLVVDEAATWMRYAGGKRALEEYTQRARKHFLGVITITQHPSTFANSTLIANCAIKILMRPDPASLEQIRRLFDLSEREGQRLLRLQVGEALLLVEQQRLLVKNDISELELVLAQTNPRRLAEWLKRPDYAPLRALLGKLGAGGLDDLATYLDREETA